MSKRKIIQIAVTPESAHLWPTIHALCNDGTIWTLTAKQKPDGRLILGDNWLPVLPVPQTKESTR